MFIILSLFIITRVGSEGQEEAWTTKQDLEDASGEGEHERGLGEKGGSEMEGDRCWGKSGHPRLRG